MGSKEALNLEGKKHLVGVQVAMGSLGAFDPWQQLESDIV